MTKVMKSPIYVYGTGAYYQKHKMKLQEKYDILKFVDSDKCGMLEGKELIKLDSILVNAIDNELIIVMCKNLNTFFEIVYKIFSYCGEKKQIEDRIIWGPFLFEERYRNVQNYKLLSSGELSVTINDISIAVASLDEFENVWDTVVNECYSYSLNSDKEDVIFDIGMNIGDTVNYFLKNNNVKHIYAYEPFSRTFERAKKNINMRDKRITALNVGMGSINDEYDLDYNDSMSCGHSTEACVNEYAYNKYLSDKLLIYEKKSIEHIKVIDCINEFSRIKEHPDCNIIVKMDCEGAEYEIFERLASAGQELLEQIDVLMIEWHYKGEEPILSVLKDHGFSWFNSKKTTNMGMIYAWHKSR